MSDDKHRPFATANAVEYKQNSKKKIKNKIKKEKNK